MQDPFTEHRGSFVYLVHEPLRPWVRPSSHAEYMPGQRFHPGDLVSVDAVRVPDVLAADNKDKSSVNAPAPTAPPAALSAATTTYLHLSDGSGWLPQTSLGRVHVQQVTVQRGLWKFYIDNYPVGQALRRHPIDSAEMHLPPTDSSIDPTPIIYAPMQLVHCDQKVTHPVTGVCWLRVQGTTGWIVDRRLHHPVNMLVPATKVQTGLFAFVALRSLSVRSLCSTASHVRTDHSVQQGQVVTVNVIRTWPSLRLNPNTMAALDDESDTENQSACGPYLRLTDGSGWVFVRKEGMEIMRQIPLMAVQTQLQVLNHPVGLSLRRFPMDDQDKILQEHPSFRPGTLVQADLQITDEQGVCYYRIVGTGGWLFDRRGRESMLKVLNEGDPLTSDESTVMSMQSSMTTAALQDGWTTDFVRGVASIVDRVHEMEYHPNSQVLCFETIDQIRIDVYCHTRTIGVKPPGEVYIWYRNCSPKALWDHMSCDLVDMMIKLRTTDRTDREVTVSYMESIVEAQTTKSVEEEETRNHLLRVDQEIDELMDKRLAYLVRIKEFDTARAAAAQATKVLEGHKKEQAISEHLHDASYGYDANGSKALRRDPVKEGPSSNDSRYSRRSRTTSNSHQAFSTRSNTSKPVKERIDYLLDLRSNETDDNSDAPFRKRSPIHEAEATDDEEESFTHSQSGDLGEGSSFESDLEGGSYTDSDVESR